MTTKRKLELAGAGLAAILLIVFLVQWINHREQIIRAEEQEKAAQAQIAEREHDIATLQQAIKDRDAENSRQIAALQQQIALVKTPQQAAQVIPQYVTVPQGQQFGPLQEIKANTPPTFKPGDFILPSEDALPLAQTLNKCKQDQASLGSCTADLADTTKQLDARTQQFKLAQTDADRWKKVAKGGSVWQRTFKIAGYVACAGGGAYLGTKIQNGGLAPSVGASAGVLGCHFVLK